MKKYRGTRYDKKVMASYLKPISVNFLGCLTSKNRWVTRPRGQPHPAGFRFEWVGQRHKRGSLKPERFEGAYLLNTSKPSAFGFRQVMELTVSTNLSVDTFNPLVEPGEGSQSVGTSTMLTFGLVGI